MKHKHKVAKITIQNYLLGDLFSTVHLLSVRSTDTQKNMSCMQQFLDNMHSRTGINFQRF